MIVERRFGHRHCVAERRLDDSRARRRGALPSPAAALTTPLREADLPCEGCLFRHGTPDVLHLTEVEKPVPAPTRC
jgi:hypothetical protein